MAKITRLSAEQRENLTAYLDGELEEAAANEIESVLAQSVVARHEVDMLSRTWDLLAALPGTQVSDEFTRKTLSSIRAAENPGSRVDQRAINRNARRGIILTGAAALLVAAGLAGFHATQRLVPNEADQLLDEFEVINHLEDYREVGDIEFLRALKARRVLAEQEDRNDG